MAASDLHFSVDQLAELARRSAIFGAQEIAGAWYFPLADIDAFAIANALPTLAPDIVNDRSTPQLMAWLRSIRQRPAVQAALATSRTGKPEQAFVPGPEHSRWG